MKKYLFIVLLVGVWSCSKPPLLSPEDFQFSAISFKKYTEKGFLFTPDTYEDKYESIGIIDATLFPEANLKNAETGSPTGSMIYWVTEPINVQKALDSLYFDCVGMGADALVQIKFEVVEEKKYRDTTNPLLIKGLNIRGFAIKRIK